MKTKGEHVNAALRKLRISGLTVAPSGDELSDCLHELEDMMSELSGSVRTSWNYEDTPNASTDSGVADTFNDAVAWNLALRLTDLYGKQPTPNMAARASAGIANWLKLTSKVNPVRQPNTMPVGSGNNRYTQDWSRFFHVQKVPNNVNTQYADNGEIVDFVLDWADWLADGVTLSSFTIESTSNITVNSSQIQNDTQVYVNCTATAIGIAEVCVNVTASNGLTDIRKVKYVIEEGC